MPKKAKAKTKPRALPKVPAAVVKAMTSLVAFADARETLKFKTSKKAADIARVVAADSLPKSYRAFVAEYGFWWVEHVNECLKLFEPESVASAFLGELDNADADEAIAFQRSNDDAVDDFFCFNPRVDLGGGELEVVAFYHDERFTLPTKKTRHSVAFDKHIVAVIDDFMDVYKDEE